MAARGLLLDIMRIEGRAPISEQLVQIGTDREAVTVALPAQVVARVLKRFEAQSRHSRSRDRAHRLRAEAPEPSPPVAAGPRSTPKKSHLDA
jgi:hypothetical protein